jgi:hypothetical protein
MSFILIKPLRTGGEIEKLARKRSVKKVADLRFRFSKNSYGGSDITICLVNELLHKLGFKIKDRIAFYYDDENPRKWIIKKTDGPFGFLMHRRSINMSYIVFKWDDKIFVPTEDDHQLKNAIYTVSGKEIHITGAY